MDRYEIKELTKKKTQAANIISVGVTWVDGRLLFKKDKKWGIFWYGICHFTKNIWAVTPLDYPNPTMITTIMVSPFEKYCEKAYTCFNFTCKLNQFDRGMFLNEFKDCGAFSLSLPLNIDKDKPWWFNTPEWQAAWTKLVIVPEGGRLRFDEEGIKKVDSL